MSMSNMPNRINPTLFLTALALIAFAANSLLARLALAGGAIDAAGYTGIRLASGALVLMALLVLQRGRKIGKTLPGNGLSALALFIYAVAFSLAYLKLGAATGALILFASVQGTMICWSFFSRERPGAREIA